MYFAFVTAIPPFPLPKDWIFCILPFPKVCSSPKLTTYARRFSFIAATNISAALAVFESTAMYNGIDLSKNGNVS